MAGCWLVSLDALGYEMEYKRYKLPQCLFLVRERRARGAARVNIIRRQELNRGDIDLLSGASELPDNGQSLIRDGLQWRQSN